MNVFLSYARKDGAAFALNLRTELSVAGINVWRDVEELAGTEEWRVQLRAAILKVDALVLVLTPGAVASQHVTNEWELALTLGKPVIVAKCLPSDAPEALAAKHYRDLTQPSTYTREMLGLTRDIQGLKEAERTSVGKKLAALLEENGHSAIHPAVEALQRWLNAGVYETKIISAVAWLLRQMCVDSRPGRSVRAIIDESISGSYVQPIWELHDLFNEQRPIFEYILSKLSKLVKDDSLDDSVPIVLAVMREAEAKELISGSAFDGYPAELKGDFDELETALAANGIGDWASGYRATAEEWRPFEASGVGVSIRQLVEGVFAFPEMTPDPPDPLFIDIRTLAGNRRLLNRLRRKGCIVIVDSVSMRHPAMQHALQQSMLDAYPNTSVVNIAPFQSAFELARKMRVILRLQVSDLEFDKRRRYPTEEYGVCREIYELDELEQWLFGRVKSMPRRMGERRKGAPARMFEGVRGRR